MYINTQVARTMNNPNSLPQKYLIQDNEHVPNFQHHTHKTQYTNDILNRGGYIPVALLLYKIGFNLIDTQQIEKTNKLNTDFDSDSMKSD